MRRSSLLYPGVWACMLLLLAAAPASALTIRADVSDSNYTSLAAQSPFSSIGEFLWQQSGSDYLASGILINNQWVLTAAHVVSGITSGNIGTMTFTLGGNTYHAAATYYNSNWNGSVSNGYDIGLVKLDSAVGNVTPVSLYDSNAENHQITTLVGYGETGTGLTGATLAAGTVRAGTNVLGLGSALNNIPWSAGGNDTMLVADFDQPGATGDPTQNLAVATTLECCAAPGDSGGGWFMAVNGQNYLVGITSFLDHNPSNPVDSMYGDICGATRVSSYLSWISQYTTYSLMPYFWTHDPNTAGNWQDANNWSPSAAPTANDTAVVDNNGTVNISSATGSVQVSSLYDGNQARGSISQSGGTVTVASSLVLGYNAGSGGTYTLSGGSLRAAYLYAGYSGSGIFNQSGGKNAVGGSLYVGYGAGSRGTYNLAGGSLAVTGQIVMAGGSASTAQLYVAKAATVQVGGLTINSGGGRSTQVKMELDANGNSLIDSSGAVSLAGALDLQSLNSYRPNQGDIFILINSTSMSGNFSSLTSNLVGQLLLDPNNPTGGYWPIFSGSADDTSYVATFQGAMAGDATGDNKVDDSDFGAIARNWEQSGKTWYDGDFNGDGTVDSTDFGAVARNWGSTGLAPSAAPLDAPIPEPATVFLLASGLLLLRRRSAAK